MRLFTVSWVIAVFFILMGGPAEAATVQDAALGKSAYASSSASDTTPAGAAVDGDASTMWQSHGSARPYTYIEVDLGGYFAISRVELALGTMTGSAPASFEVQAQNRGCWKTVPQTLVTNNPTSGIAKTFDIAPAVVTDKLRFVCHRKGNGCRVRTFAAFGVSSTASDAPPSTCGGGVQVVRRAPAYDYAEFLPASYNADPTTTFPLILSFHGVGGETLQADRSGIYTRDDETGTQVRSPEGLARRLQNVTFRQTFGAVVVSPHCREVGVWDRDDPEVPGSQAGAGANCSFNQARMQQLWDDVLSTYRIDRDKIYLTGLSGGGFALNRFAFDHINEIAAIVPIAADTGSIPKTFSNGIPVPDANGRHICDMKALPVFGIHGTRDNTVGITGTVGFQDNLNVKCWPTSGPKDPRMRIRLMVGATHSGTTWDRAYEDPKVYDWLFAQRLNPRLPGPVYVGPAVTLTSPATRTIAYSPTASATFNATADGSGGGIVKYSSVAYPLPNRKEWLTVQDNLSTGTFTFSGFTPPAPGTTTTYHYRLIATDGLGLTGHKDVTVRVTGPPAP